MTKSFITVEIHSYIVSPSAEYSADNPDRDVSTDHVPTGCAIASMLTELCLVLTADAHRVELHPDERGVRAANRLRGEDELLSHRASVLCRLPHLGHREPTTRVHGYLHST